MSRRPTSAEEALQYLGVSFASAFTFAIVFVIVHTLSLPKTDAAYGSNPFANPFVSQALFFVAGASALVAFPFYALFGRGLPATHVGWVAGVVTLTWIIAATPFLGPVGWLGSYVALLVGLIAARFVVRPYSPPILDATTPNR
ncbi:MAG: hypothetical protein SF069_08765 [Phycisphaerae bacterium]|nr:hypothetical protein [Phycisphaerae bacterium]